MKTHLQPSSTLFTLMLILTTTICFPAVWCQEIQPYNVCNQSVICGDIIFDYPFWGLGRPSYCGHPGFQLNCQSNVPILLIESVSYRVLHTDMSTKTISIARNDLWSNLCPKLLYNTTYNSTIFNGDNFGQQNISIYYECNTGIPSEKSSVNNHQTSCSIISSRSNSTTVYKGNNSGQRNKSTFTVVLDSVTFSQLNRTHSECNKTDIWGGLPIDQNYQISCNLNSTRSDGYFYRTSLEAPFSSIMQCNNHIVVPVNQSSAERLTSRDATKSDLITALTSGFNLEWIVNKKSCDQCMFSGGRCGSSDTSPDLFTCYCANGNFSRTCNDTNRSEGSKATPRSKASTGSQASAGSKASTWKLVIGLSCGIAGIILMFVIPYKKWGFWGTRKNADHQIEIFIQNYGSLAPQRYKYSEIKKMTKRFLEKVGQGGYGSVFKGELPNGKTVAVKLLSDATGDGEDFINEVAAIGRTSHVNIVTLLGFCYEGKKRALMYEFMPNGSLDNFLRGDGSRLDWNTLFMIAKGIARGLEYLHQGCNTRIVHFDIKPHNILLDKEFVPKISDFGLAKLCKTKESIMSVMGARGTAGYMAPEVYFRSLGGASHKSDVYSYGMMVLEMSGGRKNNHAHITNASDACFSDWIYQQVETGGSLGDYGVTTEEDEELARKMMIVSLWCIQSDPSDRPSISKVVELLEGSVESLQVPPRRFWSSPQGPSPLEMQSSTTKNQLPV